MQRLRQSIRPKNGTLYRAITKNNTRPLLLRPPLPIPLTGFQSVTLRAQYFMARRAARWAELRPDCPPDFFHSNRHNRHNRHDFPAYPRNPVSHPFGDKFMGDFHRCISLILGEEGGIENHRKDPGGLTNYGISQRSYPTLNIAALTLDDAKAIYRRDYWNPIRGDELPSGLDLTLFDSAINQGPVTAIQLLQHALQIKADGRLGPITLAASFKAMPDLLDDFDAERALRYEFNRNEETFGRGWYRRLLRINRRAWARAVS